MKQQMQQVIMNLAPAGATEINERLCFFNEQSKVTYFLYGLPIFHHTEDEKFGYRLAAGMFVGHGYCRKSEIEKTWPASLGSIKNWVRDYNEYGASALIGSKKRKSVCVVLTETIRIQAQELLNEGYSRTDVAKQLGIKYDTIRKAVKSGRLIMPENKSDTATQAMPQPQNEQSSPTPEIVPPTPTPISPTPEPVLPVSPVTATTLSDRTAADAQMDMGIACARVPERVLASLGQGGPVQSKFENALDVANGGVLCALPALEANGLFQNIDDYFQLPNGYYDLTHIICLLSFMYLCRIKTFEKLRFESSGELGKLLGLDRIPEVKTLREKLSHLAENGDNVLKWAADLAKQWMEANADLAGVLLVDGHMSVYHGSQTQLPRKYVSRLRLCMRGTTYFYVNDILGQPFFRVEKVINDGLINALENDIIPRLLIDVPNQPSEEQLKDNADLHRFIVEFDREGYSPALLKRLWDNHRIGCLTYHKHPGPDWPEEEFKEYKENMPNGEKVCMKLAERTIVIGSKKDERVEVREIRKLTDTGHQTSVISTVRTLSFTILATYMFSRWTQENFFKYMLEHFDFDGLTGYGTSSLSGTEKVVNPSWRSFSSKINTINGKLKYRLAKFATVQLNPEQDDKKQEKQIKEKAQLIEEIDLLKNELEGLKEKRKDIPKHVELQSLPEELQFKCLDPSRRLFTDTIKMIDYRAETAMAAILKEHLDREDDARAILRELFKKSVDLLPDMQNKKLYVRLHSFNTRRHNQAVVALIEELNATETIYPGTDMKLIYETVWNGD